jgi:hypothetical protein
LEWLSFTLKMKTNNRDLPLDQFIEFALYDKVDGYYMKKIPLEKKEILLLLQILQESFQK